MARKDSAAPAEQAPAVPFEIGELEIGPAEVTSESEQDANLRAAVETVARRGTAGRLHTTDARKLRKLLRQSTARLRPAAAIKFEANVEYDDGSADVVFAVVPTVWRPEDNSYRNTAPEEA